ncbi:hypothetical protein FQA39_LY05490 [Lamprigera yunnana]|nr:hypothetical protein FQA39_LY05490 [Lamprigera yunnana]
MAPTYKLIYWPISGIAEPIRYLLSYGGIDFEDFRFVQKKWPEIKPDMPFGQVPVLEIDGKAAYQSIAICRYLAKKVKLCGSNDWEDMEIDAVVDTIDDFRKKVSLYWYETNSYFKNKLKGPLLAETIPYFLGHLEEIAKTNKGYLVAGRLSWADFYFVGILEYLKIVFEKAFIEGYPNLQKLENNVLNLPAIKEWNAKRPATENLLYPYSGETEEEFQKKC